MSAGIDYGRYPMANGQLPNRDAATGIRYGVIPCHEVDGWNEAAEGKYGEPSCPKCGNEQLVEYEDRLPPRYRFSKQRARLAMLACKGGGDYYCAHCKRPLCNDACQPDSANSWEVEEDGFFAFTNGDDCVDIFVTLSPYFTRAEFCSPCAPGACYLTSPNDDGERAYCFPHEWFDGGKAPYPVYRVDTGEEVSSEHPAIGREGS